ncbi:MAG: M24 family metallopeptidase [Methanospirillum sp.]|nr:M24 family metallopeptidase [Methanospirillum sp.]
MDLLDQAISSSGAAAYVGYASSADPDMRYLTRFQTTDPVIYLKRPGERGLMVVSQMEYARAAAESAFAPVTRAEAGLFTHWTSPSDRWNATAMAIAGLAGGDVLVPASFPISLARSLEAHCRVLVDEDTVRRRRAVKVPAEVDEIRAVQQANEAAMAAAVGLVRAAEVRDGLLVAGDEPLTAERVRAECHRTLLAHGCRAADTIVACGEQAAQPHQRGTGPLEACQPIVIDIFPQDELTGYFADMTRTVVKGEPPGEVLEMFEAARDAKALAVGRIRAGVEGAEVHQAVIELFAERGYPSDATGFTHNLGHGVGLEVHELPTLGPGGGPLETGNVVTVEPGLYLPGVGGVRIEDMGLVTADGFENLTRFPEELRV